VQPRSLPGSKIGQANRALGSSTSGLEQWEHGILWLNGRRKYLQLRQFSLAEG
jgi:hypothetical protein